MATPKRGIIFVQQHDHRGHDASGAFVPKSQLFKRHYGITDYNYIDNSLPREQRAKPMLTTLAAAQKNLEVVAYFGHGDVSGLVTPHIYRHGVRDFAAALRKVVGADARVLLYACSAGVRGGWAEMLSGLMGPGIHVYGHDRRGHTTSNPYVTHYPAGAPGSEYVIPGTTHHPQWNNWVCKLKCEREPRHNNGNSKGPLWLRFPFMTTEAILAECAAYDHTQVKHHDEHCPYHHHNLQCKEGKKHPERYGGQPKHTPAPAHAHH